MTEGMSMSLAAQQLLALQPVVSEPVRAQQPSVDVSSARPESFQQNRYEEPLPPGREADFKPLLDLAGKVSDGFSAVLKKTDAPVDEKLAKNFPELVAMKNALTELRELSRVEMQFELIGKSLHLAAGNLRALYQQQG